jgi:MFS family permease
MIRRPPLILALLTGLNLLNYLDRFVLAAVLSRVKDDLVLGGSQAGALAPAFLVGYGISSPLFGALADRGFKRTTLLAIGVVVWSLATFASGWAQGFWSLLCCRMIVGVGEASYASVAPALIDDLAPADRKSRHLAVFYAATPIGSALGFLSGGILQTHFGWRGALQLVGGPGVILALTCWFIADSPRAVLRGERGLRAMLSPLLESRLYVRTVLGYSLQTFALGGFAHWGPTAVHKTFGTKLETVDIVFGGLLVVAGFVGTSIGGILGDRAVAKGNGSPAVAHLRICVLSSVIGAPFALLCLAAPSTPWFFALIFIAELGIFLSTASINAAILQSVPPALRTSAMGVAIFSIHAFGDFWSPPIVGALSDHASWRVALSPLGAALLLSILAWRAVEPVGERRPTGGRVP